METCDYRNPMLLHVEEYSVGKAANSSTPPSAIDDRELQRILRDGTNRFFDCTRESLSKLRAYVVVPCSDVLQLGLSLR